MEELIFSLITCFLHRRFFPKGEVLRGLPVITEGCPESPGPSAPVRIRAA